MPARGRDRHGRGLRGPLALAGPMNPRAASPPARAGKSEFFAEAVQAAVDRISRQCPDALAGVAVGIEDVPLLESAWTGSRVPLAAAVEAVPDRAASRRGLRILVYRTIVEQLSALTGRSVEEIDPEGLSDED